jgi:hypothetical protein
MRFLMVACEATHFLNLDHVAKVEVGVRNNAGRRVTRIYYATPSDAGEWLYYEDFDGDAAVTIERTMKQIAGAPVSAP